MLTKNIVFDVGNVIVRWDPLTVTREIFPLHPDSDALTQQLFKSPTWFDLNKGKISEQEAIHIYHRQLNLNVEQLEILMAAIKKSLIPIEGSFDLLQKLYDAKFPLYALTDNTHEIIAYLKKTYDFWKYFNGVVMSANLGVLKPSPQIYNYLLSTYKLNPSETIFIDDYFPNVEGAIKMGISGIQFHNVEQCEEELRKLIT